MIRLSGLVDLRAIHSFGDDRKKVSEGIPVDNMSDDGASPTPMGSGDEGNMPKAQLMNLQKQAAELYNMTNDNQGLEPWLQEKLTMAVEAINVVYTYLQYEAKKPASLGNGNGAPADPTNTGSDGNNPAV